VAPIGDGQSSREDSSTRSLRTPARTGVLASGTHIWCRWLNALSAHRTSREPHHDDASTGCSSFSSQTRNGVGRRFVNNPTETSSTLRTRHRVSHSLK